jgi:vacuolar-type H+-ATPase subunit B/Vma2
VVQTIKEFIRSIINMDKIENAKFEDLAEVDTGDGKLRRGRGLGSR